MAKTLFKQFNQQFQPDPDINGDRLQSSESTRIENG